MKSSFSSILQELCSISENGTKLWHSIILHKYCKFYIHMYMRWNGGSGAICWRKEICGWIQSSHLVVIASKLSERAFIESKDSFSFKNEILLKRKLNYVLLKYVGCFKCIETTKKWRWKIVFLSRHVSSCSFLILLSKVI